MKYSQGVNRADRGLLRKRERTLKSGRGSKSGRPIPVVFDELYGSDQMDTEFISIVIGDFSAYHGLR